MWEKHTPHHATKPNTTEGRCHVFIIPAQATGARCPRTCAVSGSARNDAGADVHGRKARLGVAGRRQRAVSLADAPELGAGA